MRPAVVVLAAIACIAPTFDCKATAPAPSARTTVDAEPRWEDVIDTTPELLVVVFPTALRRDKVYGPLLGRVIELVREQSRVVAETRALEAMEDADEVIVGVRPDATGAARGGSTGESAGEVVVVVRGVRAEVDPATLVDAEGHPLWAPGPNGRVRELVRSDNPSSASPPDSRIPASLFELPGRTWLIASGDARARARAVFAQPPLGPRRTLRFEPKTGDTLAVLRIDGPSLVARVRALRSSGPLGAVGQHLEAVTLELAAGPAAPDVASDADLHRTIRTYLSYADRDAAALAEVTVRDVIGAIGRKRPDDLVWLASASVDRPLQSTTSGKSVVVTAPLPPRLVGALLHAGAASLEAVPAAP